MAAEYPDELFTVDPNEFVARRDAIVKDLRAGGDKEAAAAVKALRRPPVALWALNQVARRWPASVDALHETAERARRAQDDALAGKAAAALRDALGDRRQRLKDVVQHAHAVVEESGRNGDAQERDIESALDALVASGQLDDDFRSGALTALPAGGEGDDLLAMMAASVPDRPAERGPSKELVAAREEVERRGRELAHAEQRVDAARVELDVATKELADAGRALEQARARVERLER